MKDQHCIRRCARRRTLVVAAVLLLAFLGRGALAKGAGIPVHIRRGNKAFEEGDFEKAFEYYTLAEEEDPLSAQSLYHKGTVFYLQGNYHEALKAFQGVIPRDRELAVLATFNQGNSLARIGELEEKANPSEALEYYWESIGAYRRTLSLDPDFWDAAYNIEFVKNRIRTLLEMMNMLSRLENPSAVRRSPQQDQKGSDDSDGEYDQEGAADQPLAEEAQPRDETARDILNEESKRRAEQNPNQGGGSNAAKDW
jgi:Ca-activated chloride channel family protein